VLGCLSALLIAALVPIGVSAISPVKNSRTLSANDSTYYQAFEKRHNNTAPSFGPPPNETEAAVLSKARSFTDNITDSNELNRTVLDAISYLEQNPYVAQVSRDGLTIFVVFKSGSESFILCRLASSSALLATRTAVIANKSIVQGNGNVAAVQPSQGRAAVVLDPFQWNFLGDTSYNVFNYMQSRLGSYSVLGYIPNDYVTLDEVANFFLGYHISDYPWIVQDGAVPHVSYGLFSWAGHGGYGNGVTIFAIGECYSGTGCGAPKSPTRGTAPADYNAYYSHDPSSVTTGTISGDPRIWIAITSSFVMDYLYAADYPQSDSLFFAFACQGLKGTDMAQAMAASGVYTYLGWTEEVTIINPGDPSLDTFFNSLTNGKTAAQSYQDVKNALKDYDWLTGAHLYYYPGPDTTGSPWYSSGDHGDWTTNWPEIFYSVTFYSNIPSSTTWGVNVGGTRYTSTGSNILVSGLTGIVSYSYDSIVTGGTGVQYACVSGCSGSFSGSTTETANYKTQYYLTVISARDSPNPGSGWFDAGTSIGAYVYSTVSGGSGIQYVCTGWSGTGSVSSSGSGTSVTFNINAPSSITWNWKTQYQLTITLSGHGASTPSSGNWYDSESSVQVTISGDASSNSSNTRYLYGGATGSGSGSYTGSGNPFTVTMNTPITETVTWTTQYMLTTNANPPSAGTATPSSGWQNAGTVVPISETPSAGFAFSSWTCSGVGCYSGTNTDPSIMMNNAMTETANFIAQVTMTVSYQILGGGTSSAPTFDYVLGGQSKTYTLTTAPTAISVDSGSSWSVTPNPLLGSTSSERWQSSQTLSGTTSTITIVFTFHHQYLQALSYSIAGGGAGYSAPVFTAKQFGLPVGQTLTGTVTGYWFDNGASWSVTNPLGGSTSSEQWISFQSASGTISSAQTIAFSYQHQYYLTMQVNPPAGGSVSPSSGWQNAGTVLTISATANTGYVFSSWTGTGSGSYSGTNNPATNAVTMSAPITETANFGQTAGTIVIQKSAVGGDATFNFTATGTGLPASFSITATSGSGSQTFSNLAPGAYSVSESGPSSPWSFTSLSCSTGGSVSAQTATISSLAAGQTVTCTYTDTKAATTGMLRVTSNPAVSTTIFVNNVARDDWGLNWVKLAPGTYTIHFTDVPGFISPSNQTVQVIADSTTTVTGYFVQVGYLHVTTNPAVMATISVDGVPRNDWGAWFPLMSGQHTVHFGDVAGFTTPVDQQVTVVAGSTVTATGNYVAGANPGPTGYGNLRVQTNPAVISSIYVNNVLMNDWGLDWVKLAPGTYTIHFTDVPGFATPANQTVTVTAGETTIVTGDFVQLGYLHVTTNPALAATISIDGVTRDDWGVWIPLMPGQHTVQLGDVAGYTTPADQQVTVVAGTSATVTGNYT
jgi:hypothetical protein